MCSSLRLRSHAVPEIFPSIYTTGSNSLREVFLVTQHGDGQGFGRLVGSLNADQNELLGPIALDVNKRRVFHYNEMKCIKNCSYNLRHCQVLFYLMILRMFVQQQARVKHLVSSVLASVCVHFNITAHHNAYINLSA